MRLILVVLSFLACSSVLGADLPIPEVIEYKRVEAQAKAEYDRKVEAARTKLLVALERYKKAAMQKGDLDGAVAIQKIIDQESGATTVINWEKKIVGTWFIRYDNRREQVVFLAGGVMKDTRNKWSIDGSKLTIFWSGGARHQFDLSTDPVSGSLNGNEKVTLEK